MPIPHRIAPRAFATRARPIAVALCSVCVLVSRNAMAQAPHVEILESNGAIDGPTDGTGTAAAWDRVRVGFRVANRMDRDIRDLEVDVSLVHAGADPAVSDETIAGWTFRETFREPIEPRSETDLHVSRELPAKQRTPRADEIAYRVRIHTYRVDHPNLNLAMAMLASPDPADQRAAMKSWEREETADRREIEDLGDELARALQRSSTTPGTTDVLRMLFAVRAIGTLGDRRHTRTLLEIPDRLDRRAWGRALVRLSAEMADKSDADEPRLRLLPTWARERTALLMLRSDDALDDAVRDAVSRLGDAAVAPLLEAARASPDAAIRARALRLLHALGRSTVRSMIAVPDRGIRIEIMRVLGKLHVIEAAVPLIDVLRSADAATRQAAADALRLIGKDAVLPLVDALGSRDDAVLVAPLEGLAEKHPEAFSAAIARIGMLEVPGESVHARVLRLQQRLFEQRRARDISEIERALDLSRDGNHVEAFAIFERIAAKDASLYATYAAAIATAHRERALQLYDRGDFDAAIGILETSRSLRRTVESDRLLLDARVAMARGYLELDDLETARAVLDAVSSSSADDRVRLLRATLFGKEARAAFERGDHGRSRKLLDRALALNARDPSLLLAHHKLLFVENLAIVAVGALVVPLCVIVAVVWVRRRFERARLERLTRAIDRG